MMVLHDFQGTKIALFDIKSNGMVPNFPSFRSNCSWYSFFIILDICLISPWNRVCSTISLGKSWETKVTEIRKTMIEKGTDVLVLSALDDVAWLLNLRGSDIQYNPVFFSYTVVTLDKVYLFVNEGQVCIAAFENFIIVFLTTCHSLAVLGTSMTSKARF